MKRWVRIKGLAAFLAVTAAIGVFWFLLVDGYARRAIEKVGTALVGAKVELDDADVSLWPAGMVLTGLRVTDPARPMTNAVETGRIAFLVEPVELLRRKIIIDEMSVDGVRFGTERSVSGEVSKPEKARPEKEAAGDGLGLPALSLPPVEEIIEKEDLETLRLARTAKAEIEKEKERWEERLEGLPDRQKIKEYEKRIKELKASMKGGPASVLGTLPELERLRKDIDADLKAIEAASGDFDSSFGSLAEKVEAAARAPERDFMRLKEKYGLSVSSLSNFTQLLLGDRASRWVDRAVFWHGKAAGVIEKRRETAKGRPARKPPRAEGLDIRFEEKRPMPDLWVKLARVGVSIDAGDLSGTVRNVTEDQPVAGVPLEFEFEGRRLKGARSVRFEGSMDRVDPEAPRDTFGLSLEDYEVKGLTLSGSPEFPLEIRHALADLDLQAAFLPGRLAAGLKASLDPISIGHAKTEDLREPARSMIPVVEEISSLKVSAEVNGTPEDYKVRVDSDLDRIIKRALSTAVADQARKWEGRLKDELGRVAHGPDGTVPGLRADLGGLSPIGSEIDKRGDLLQGLMKESAAPAAPGIKLPF